MVARIPTRRIVADFSGASEVPAAMAAMKLAGVCADEVFAALGDEGHKPMRWRDEQGEALAYAPDDFCRVARALIEAKEQDRGS